METIELAWSDDLAPPIFIWKVKNELLSSPNYRSSILRLLFSQKRKSNLVSRRQTKKMKNYKNSFLAFKILEGSFRGTVGRTVASEARYPQFEYYQRKRLMY